jgi:hypothetical protein
MKKIIIAILLASIIITPCYAVNFMDKLICKKVILRANNMPVLVNRVTGEVKYILQNDGRWVLLTGIWKNRCQAMYETQVSSK